MWGSIGFIVAVVGVGYRARHVLPLAAVPLLVLATMVGDARVSLASFPKRRRSHHASGALDRPASCSGPEVVALIGGRRVHVRRARPVLHVLFHTPRRARATARRRPAGCGRSASRARSASSRGCRGSIRRLHAAADPHRELRACGRALSTDRLARAQLSRCCSSPRCCTRRRSARSTPHRSATSTSSSAAGSRRAGRRSTAASRSASAGALGGLRERLRVGASRAPRSTFTLGGGLRVGIGMLVAALEAAAPRSAVARRPAAANARSSERRQVCVIISNRFMRLTRSFP